MKNIYVKIEGMHCSHCEDTIRNALLNIKNICQVDFDGFIACITYKENLNKEDIVRIILDKDYITKEEYISDDIKNLKNIIKLKEFIIIFLSIVLIVYLLYKIFGFNIFNVIPTIDYINILKT